MATRKTVLSGQQKMFLKEFAALEKRIDDRIDFNAQSFKEYVDSRLGPVLTGMKEMRRDVTGLRTSITGVQGDITGLRNGITGVQGDITGLRTSITGIQGDITGLRSSIAGVQGDITEMRGDIKGMREELKGQGARMDTYYNGIAKMVENLTGTVSDQKGELRNHERRITALEGRA